MSCRVAEVGSLSCTAKNITCFFKTIFFRTVNIRLDWKVFWESENWSKLLESAFWNVFCRNPFKSAVLYLLCCTHCTTQCGPHCITLLRHTECCLLTEATHAYIAILVPWKRIKLIPCSLTSLACFRRRPKMIRARRVGFFNFRSGRVRVLKKYFGSGRVGLGIGYLYQIPSQLGIMGYWNLDRVFAEYLPYFLYFLISIILFD